MKKQILSVMLATALAAGAVTVPVGNHVVSVEAAKKKVPTIKKLHKAVVDAYGENFVANVALTKKEANERFGLSSGWYKAVSADIPMISTNIDTLVIVRSKNAKSKKKIKKALKSYQQAQINDTMQYPNNLLKAQASKVYTKGDYVFFIMLGFIDSALEDAGVEEDMIEGYREQNQIAVDAIDALFA